MRTCLTGLGMTALAGVLALAPATGTAQDKTGWPSSIKVGTASQGGTYFIYGAGWAGLIQEMLGVPASSEVTGGPVQNFALTQTNDVQMAMTTMGPAREAWDGLSPIAPGVQMRDVRATFPMYQTPFQIIALESSGIQSVADLDGKTVGNGPRGGTCGTYFPQYFDALGVETNDQFGGASDLAGQVKDGLIDAFAFCAGLPIAAFSELEAQNPVNIFAFTPEEQATLVEQFPVSAFEIPADTYTSQHEPQHSVAMWNFGIAHKDLPQSFVYEVMKVVLDNNDRMMQIHQAAAETLPENWVHNKFLPFHPGAVQYYKEKGFDIPENLIPAEYEG
ncbi:MAG: TAXI family TRAP transporter solute-binding subunit [Geminicoccaceae bacterium]|nr:TAXI family TRAP transporter solute-binding subunit [Geminicoccaceae bacterium]